MITFSPSPRLPRLTLAAAFSAASLLSGVAFGQTAPAPGTPPPPAGQPVPAAPPPAAQPAPAPAPAPAPLPPGSAAEPAPLAPTPLGKPLIDVSVPDPGPPPKRTYHVHDGFYLRMSAGVAYGAANVNADGNFYPDYDVNGVGLSLDAMVGGSPSTGLALGGGLTVSGYGQDGAGGFLLAGVFVDGFPDPVNGWHLGGLLGFAGVTSSGNGSEPDFSGGGFGLSAWLGHDFWVADEWSMGPLLRFNGAIARDASRDDDAQPTTLSNATFEGTLSFSVLYH